MSYPISQEIKDLQGEFEGGASLNVDWYQKIIQGAELTLDNINPETLKRVVPIYGGLTRELQVYYCPPDLEVPSRIYTRDRRSYFDYLPASQFYGRRYQFRNYDKFTIEYVNGIRYIVIRHPTSEAVAIIDPMDGTETQTGVAMSINKYNLLPGASASMQGTFSDTAYTLGGTLPAATDISGMLFGVAIIPIYLDSAEDLDTTGIVLQLIDENGNYFEVQSSQDSVGTYIRDGQNMVRFWMQSATQTGSPDPTNIVAYSLKIPMTAGNSQTVILGKITVQTSHLFELEYYSRYLFIDGTTMAWKDSCKLGDLINLDRDARGIIHYETAILIFNSEKIAQSNPGQLTNLQQQLQRKYAQYWENHPSSAEPIIGTILPDIPHSLEPYYEGYGSPIPERFGESVDAAQISPQPVFYIDAETPQGNFDGTNRTFLLSRAPDPSSSLVLTLNGGVLTLGVDYDISGNIITFITAPSPAFAGLPFSASYRYYAGF